MTQTRGNVRIGIEGLQEVQAAMMRIAARLLSGDGIAAAVGRVTLALHRVAVANTHVGRYVQTRTGRYRWAPPNTPGARGGGALRASQMVEMPTDHERPVGRVLLNPSTINPYTGQRPAVYGLYEHQRGGEHAFYALALDNANAEGVIERETMAVLYEVIDAK